MASDSVTISLRIPKTLNADLEKYVKRGKYASKTEALREAMRAKLYSGIESMRGAIKKKRKNTSLSDWRAKEWKSALKKANGDSKKAYAIIKAREKKALEGLKL